MIRMTAIKLVTDQDPPTIIFHTCIPSNTTYDIEKSKIFQQANKRFTFH